MITLMTTVLVMIRMSMKTMIVITIITPSFSCSPTPWFDHDHVGLSFETPSEALQNFPLTRLRSFALEA